MATSCSTAVHLLVQYKWQPCVSALSMHTNTIAMHCTLWVTCRSSAYTERCACTYTGLHYTHTVVQSVKVKCVWMWIRVLVNVYCAATAAARSCSWWCNCAHANVKRNVLMYMWIRVFKCIYFVFLCTCGYVYLWMHLLCKQQEVVVDVVDEEYQLPPDAQDVKDR
jgi:hypothetical protein